LLHLDDQWGGPRRGLERIGLLELDIGNDRLILGLRRNGLLGSNLWRRLRSDRRALFPRSELLRQQLPVR
jgi:hypothetical protein